MKKSWKQVCLGFKERDITYSPYWIGIGWLEPAASIWTVGGFELAKQLLFAMKFGRNIIRHSTLPCFGPDERLV